MKEEKITPNILEQDFANLLLESMADGVFTLDREGLITSWNPAMERITGYSLKEAIGNSCSILGFNSCFGSTCPTGLLECGIISYGKVDGKECFLRHKNGKDVPVVKSARVVRNDRDEIKGIVETIMDMSMLYKARQETEEANRRLGESYRLDKIIGKSRHMQKVFSAIEAAAASEATILIQGESGTGKELVAGAIHYRSMRKGRAFVTLNCSALSESLLESELFGHAKGAFTGALYDRAGRFEKAEGGTVFLDEIGDISRYIQVKLLRVIQEREVERVGESKKRKVDIRVITATNKDLYNLIRQGDFREDLYYRLKVFPIYIPPLRERKDDIPILVSHFIQKQNQKTGKRISAATSPAMRILLDYNWPGNVRELENAIEHAFVLCDTDHIDIFDLPVEIRQTEYHPPFSSHPSEPVHTRTFGKRLTRKSLLEILNDSDWNKAETARRVGLSRASIWKYMKKWDIPMQRD